MTITVELPPDVELRFKAEAEGRGVSVAQIVEDFLVSHTRPASHPRRLVAEELDQSFEEAADLIPPGVSPLSDWDLSRESIYTREDDWNR